MTIQIISGGVSSSGLTVSAGNELEVLSGGYVYSTTVLNGGVELLSSGALANGETVSSGGELIGPGEIADNSENFIEGSISGVAVGDAVSGYGIINMSSGGVASGLVLQNGRLYVSSGATSSKTLVTYDSGGLGGSYEDVSGLSVSAVVSGAFTSEVVESGGVSDDATISSGGSATILSGGTANDLVIDSGGSATFAYGGLFSDVTVSSGARLVVDLLVSSGQSLGYGPSLAGVTLLSGGVMELVNPTVLSGGTLTLSSGTIVDGATVSAGGKLIGPGEIADNSESFIEGSISGVAMGDAVSGYGIANISSGGVASGLVLQNGRLYVSSGATSSKTLVTYDGGGLGGSYEDVSGLSVSAVVSGAFTSEVVESGGVSDDATISSGGSATILSGGTADNLVIDSGGSATLDYGALISDVTISSGARLTYDLLVSSGQTLGYGPSISGVTLLAGGVMELVNPTVLSGGTLTLSSGTIVDGATVSAGGKLIGPGEIADNSESFIEGSISGVAMGDAVSGYGIANISSGGVASGLVLQNGRLYVSSGATSSKTLVTYDGGGLGGSYEDVSGLSVSAVVSGVDTLEYVESGGVSDNAIISSGGSATISSGGTANNLVIDSGGSATIGYGGLFSDVTVSSGARLVVDLLVSSGQTLGYGPSLVGVTLISGGVLELVNPMVLSGGTLTLSSGTIVDGATVSAGGKLIGPGEIADDSESFIEGSISGVAMGDAVSGYGIANLSSGGVASGLLLQNGRLYVSSGATSSETRVTYDGGGLGGSYEDVYGVSVDTVVSGADTFEYVESGGVSDNATIDSGGAETLSSGATGDDITVSAGGVVGGPGLLIGTNAILGAANSATVGGDGKLLVRSGGVASRTTVLSGGTVDVSFSGTATATVVSNGGQENISSGGLGSGDTIQSGGLVVVLSGGTASDETVQSGGSEVISSGGVASGTILSGGKDDIGAGGSASGTRVLSGGIERIRASGTTTGTVVSSGGQELVSSGAVASATTVSSGGLEYVYAGGVASGTTVLAGGREYVSSGGKAVGAIVSSGGAVYVQAGTTTGTVVGGGGQEVVSSGGVASGTALQSGGSEYIRASGHVSALVVSAGGQELVSSGGVASGTTVLGGGLEYVYSGGVTIATTVSNVGRETIYSGGVASGLTVHAGGVLVDDGQVRIAGAGTLAAYLSGSGSIVQTAAGDLLISGAGAAFGGDAVIEGGTIELATSGALGSGYVQFVAPVTGSAVLQIDAADAPAAGGTFANVISNFSSAGEDIDLRSIAFVSGASATVVGSTLVLHDGGKTYTFEIAGTTAGAYPVLSDGHGGTLIDPTTAATPRALDPKVLAFAHAAAAFAPSDAATAALVSSTSPGGATPFLHATASATAGRL